MSPLPPCRPLTYIIFNIIKTFHALYTDLLFLLTSLIVADCQLLLLLLTHLDYYMSRVTNDYNFIYKNDPSVLE